ncbi:MAG: hypothetical protein KC656_33050, partial [Myxococcales bacterium]|nr:hypothetical protein [Myxococcales bacterium]
LPIAVTTDSPCDGGTPAGLLDLFVGGGTALADLGGTLTPFVVTPSAPDLDLDGDGLETFEVTSAGPPGCQPVVTGCTDGDGTPIPGRGCATDPRMADGYSTALTLHAVPATLVPAP